MQILFLKIIICFTYYFLYFNIAKYNKNIDILYYKRHKNIKNTKKRNYFAYFYTF